MFGSIVYAAYWIQLEINLECIIGLDIPQSLIIATLCMSESYNGPLYSKCVGDLDL